MSDAIFIELADAWDAMAASEESAARRETLRECADGLRMLVETRKPKDCPHADRPFRFCYECKVQPCPIGLGRRK